MGGGAGIDEEQAHSAPNWKGRNGFIGEGVTILLPHSCHLYTVHVLRGILWVLGSPQGPSPASGSCGGTRGWWGGLGGPLPARLSRPWLWGWRQWWGSWGCARVRAR